MNLTHNEIRELIFNIILQLPIDTFDEWIGIKRDDKTSKYTYSVTETDGDHFEIVVYYEGSRVLVIGYEAFIPMHRITFDVVRDFFGPGYFMHYDGIRITHSDGSLLINEETKIAASNIPKLYDLVCNIFDALRDKLERKSKIMHDALAKKSISGLTTKEVFVLDQKFFKTGDIYLLHISPEYGGNIYSGTCNAPSDTELPLWVYAICSDVCSSVIDFEFKPKEPAFGVDLVRIQVHAEDIENGLIEVTRKLCNEALIQDKEFNRYEG